MSPTIERTSEAIVIKLPLTTPAKQLQNMLNYFRYVELGATSQITSEQVTELAAASKAGWWEANKHRFEGKPGFEKTTKKS